MRHSASVSWAIVPPGIWQKSTSRMAHPLGQKQSEHQGFESRNWSSCCDSLWCFRELKYSTVYMCVATIVVVTPDCPDNAANIIAIRVALYLYKR